MDYLLILSKTHQPLPEEMLAYRGEKINWQKELPETYQDVFAWVSQDSSRMCHVYDFQPIRQRVFDDGDTLYLLHGTAFDANGKLILSAKAASSFLPEGNYTGIYSHAKITDRGECFISADQLGFSPLYYAESEDLIFAGNDPFLIAHYLHQLGCEIAPEPTLPVWLIDSIDIESDHSGFRYIRRVRPMEYLHVSAENTLAFRPKDLEEGGADYEASLEQFRRQSVRILQSLQEHYTLIAHLTGGFDTRVVFSQLLSAGIEKDISFTTEGFDGSPDVEVARLLARHYGLNWKQNAPSITEESEKPEAAVARQNRINNLVCAGERGFVNPLEWTYVPDFVPGDKPVIKLTGLGGEYANTEEHYNRFKGLMAKQFKSPVVDDMLTRKQLEYAGDAIGYNTTFQLLSDKGKAAYALHRKEMAAHLIAHFDNLDTAINGFRVYRSKNHHGGHGCKNAGYYAPLYQPALIRAGNMSTNEERKAKKLFFDLDRMADKQLPLFPMEHRGWHPLCYQNLPEEEQEAYRRIKPAQFPWEDEDTSKGLYAASLQVQEKLHAAMLLRYEASISLIKARIPKDLPPELLEHVDVEAIQKLVDDLTVDSWGREARCLMNLLGVADWCDCIREFFPRGHAGAWRIAQVPDISRTDKIACDGRWYQKAMTKLLDAEKARQMAPSFLKQYPFFHTVRQSAMVQGTMLNNGQLVDLARGGTMFLKTKTVRAEGGRFLFSSFFAACEQLELPERMQFYNLSVVHNFLSSAGARKQDKRFADIRGYVADMIRLPHGGGVLDAMHAVQDSAYDRIYTLIWYAQVLRECGDAAAADQIDAWLKETELPYLRSIEYAKMGNWGRLRALSARLMLELYFEEMTQLDVIAKDVLQLICAQFIEEGLELYRNPAITSSLLQYIRQIAGMLECAGGGNEEIRSFVGTSERILSALALPGAKRCILPALDNADEVPTPMTPHPGVVNAGMGMGVFRSDEIMFALRASGGGHLSHHADNGALLLAVNGNQVFINAGRAEQNAEGHSGVWYSSMAGLAPTFALKETTSSACRITGDENAFEAVLDSTFATHGPLHRHISYAGRELSIMDEFEGEQEMANIQFILHPDCINVSQSGNRITWYHHGIVMTLQVEGAQANVTLGKITQPNRTLCTVRIEAPSPCRVESRLKMDLDGI